MKHITCIEDLRQVHMRKVPKAFFDYADRGSYAEETLRANRDDRIAAADPGTGWSDRHAVW